MKRGERKARIAIELEALAKRRGRLDPRKVVEWARQNRESALHGCFQWDNGKAAEAYRVWQARELIVSVEVVHADGKKRQVWVSPKASRGKGGYRRLVEIKSDAQLKRDLLDQALSEVELVCDKYEDLCELAGVRTAVKLIRLGGKAA